MAVKRSKRMAVVLTMAERAENQAAQQLQSARQQQQLEQAKLQELKDYVQDYAQQIDQRREAITAQTLMTYRQFLQQLDQSVSVQQRRVNQVETMIERLLKQWQQLYHRRRSIAELIERLEVSENALLEKQLQKEIDELSNLNRLRS